jgi:hypothetical protein
MSSRNVGAVALVILLGLVIGTLGLVEADLYAVGVLLLFLGGVGAAVLVGDYLIRYFSAKRHALAAAASAHDGRAPVGVRTAWAGTLASSRSHVRAARR